MSTLSKFFLIVILFANPKICKSACFKGSNNTKLSEITQLLQQPFLDSTAKEKVRKTLEDISSSANLKSYYSAIHLINEAYKYKIISNHDETSVSYKNFLKLIKTGAFSHIIRQQRLKEGHLFQEQNYYDFAYNEYENFINTQKTLENYQELLSRYYGEDKNEKKRNMATIIKLTDLIKESFFQEDVQNITLNYSIENHTNDTQTKTASCFDLFFEKNLPDSNSSRLFLEAKHFSERPYNLSEQINMTTYSWKIGRMLASEGVRSHTQIETINDLAKILILGEMQQKVCDSEGYFYSANEIELLLASRTLQHSIADTFLSDLFHETHNQSIPSRRCNLNHFNELSQNLRTQILKSWLRVKNPDGTCNKEFIKRSGGHSALVSKLTNKVDEIYLQRLYSFRQQNQPAYNEEANTWNIVLNFAKANQYYNPPWNPSSLIPQGYPLRPIEHDRAIIWDYFVLFLRPATDYINITQLTPFQNYNLPATANSYIPQALPVIPTAPPF
jgi:hypothetical protein